MEDSKLRELAIAYRDLKARQAEFQEQADDMKTQAALANKALLDHMEAIGISNFDLDDKKFFIKSMSSAKIVEGMKEKVVEWLKADEEGKALVHDHVDSKTLSGFLMERFVKGGALPPSDLIEDPAKWTGRIVQMNSVSKKKD